MKKVDLYVPIYDSVVTYPLYSDSFDENNKNWRSDEDFLVNDILTNI